MCNTVDIDHCGLLVNCSKAHVGQELLNQLKDMGFMVEQTFPSKIMSDTLQAIYQRNVDIDILKVRKDFRRLEIFLVKEGLTPMELAHEKLARNHIALMPKKQDANEMLKVMRVIEKNSRVLVASGINHCEIHENGDGHHTVGTTVLYYAPISPISVSSNIKVIELCLPGVHVEYTVP